MPGTINFDTKTITFDPLPEKEKTFSRYLRFRHLRPHMTEAKTFQIDREGVLTSYMEENVEKTFYKSYFPLEGDLLEIEYPASYGYFLFGKDGDGEWKYTTKTA